MLSALRSEGCLSYLCSTVPNVYAPDAVQCLVAPSTGAACMLQGLAFVLQ